MAKDAVATMGELLPDDAGGRDAVHVAVVSAVCSAIKLTPGQDIGLSPDQSSIGNDVEANPYAPKKIGIVDPFLKVMVMPGQRFWLYLYPRTITGLNHHWTHPAFPDAKPNELYAHPAEKIASAKWIEEWARSYGVTYSDMIDAARDYLGTGEYFVRGGTFESESVPTEFWTHYERVTGEVVPDRNRGSFFSCSC